MANFFSAKKARQKPEQTLTLQVSRLDFNGSGVAMHRNKPVFIAGALPGERVEATIYQQKSKYALAKVQKILDSSEFRQTPPCPHFAVCGGCDLQHLQYAQQLQFKQQKVQELMHRNGIKQDLPWQPALTADEFAYRRKARLGVQYDKAGQAILGFRKKATNQLLPIKHCPVLVAELTDVFQLLKSQLAKLSQAKAIGHIEAIVTEHEQVTLVIRQLKALKQRDRELWLEFAAQQQWQILLDDGEHITALSGDMAMHYRIDDDIIIEFCSNNFIQVNESINRQMIAQAIDWLALTADDVVLDLFCGLGNFSLPMAKRVRQVVGIEGVDEMVHRADANATRNGIENCQFFQADLNDDWGDVTWAGKRYNKALLDPARAGAFVACQQLISQQIAQILYVSCDPATLARDAALLLEAGYQISKIAVMDMFSQTKHIETMVLFEQRDG